MSALTGARWCAGRNPGPGWQHATLPSNKESRADELLLIETDNRFFRKGGLKARVDHRIGFSVLARFARTSCDRTCQGPFVIVEGISRAAGGVRVGLPEAGKVSAIPPEGGIHFGVIHGIEVALHFAPAAFQFGQTGGVVTEMEPRIGGWIERKTCQWVCCQQ